MPVPVFAVISSILCLSSAHLKLKLISVQDVEKELEVQIGMKQEMELSMKMLEKDICEKQDALVELRQQLEDLRAINQQLSHKSQVRLRYLTSRLCRKRAGR